MTYKERCENTVEYCHGRQGNIQIITCCTYSQILSSTTIYVARILGEIEDFNSQLFSAQTLGSVDHTAHVGLSHLQYG